MARNRLGAVPARVADECWALWQLARGGGLSPMPVRRLGEISRAMRDYGPIGAAASVAAIRHRDPVALIDDRGPLTFADIEARSNAVANALRSRGLRAGDGVAILAGNHRGFLDALFAAAKCGARIVLLNTDFGAAQLAEVVRREGADLLVYDAEFADAVRGIDVRLAATDSLEALVHGEDVEKWMSITGKAGTCGLTAVGSLLDTHATLNLSMLTLMQKKLQGSIFGGANPYHDIPLLLSLYQLGKLNLDDMVSRCYRLDKINDGYRDMLAGKNIRGIIRCTEADR